MIQWKRLVIFLLLNVLVSATTTLAVISLWDRAHRGEQPETTATAPLLAFPVVSSSGDSTVDELGPDEVGPSPHQMQAYQVSAGETLGEIALAFDIEVDELLALNGYTNPDSIGAGSIIFVPVAAPVDSGEGSGMAVSGGDVVEGKPLPAGTQAQVEIVAVIGAGDLNSERVQIRGLGEGVTLSLTGWRLMDGDGYIYTFPQITLYSNGAVNVHSKAGVDTVVALHWNTGEALWESGERATVVDQSGYIQAVYTVP